MEPCPAADPNDCSRALARAAATRTCPRTSWRAPRALDRLAHRDGDGLPVVSVYLAVTGGPDARRALRTKADSLLHEISSLAEDRSLDHAARMSLRTTWSESSGSTDEPIRHGTLAIFSCSGAGLFEVVRLPRAVRDRVIVDATPWIGPMLAVLDQYPPLLFARRGPRVRPCVGALPR